jgi:hypothetical protein
MFKEQLAMVVTGRVLPVATGTKALRDPEGDET